MLFDWVFFILYGVQHLWALKDCNGCGCVPLNLFLLILGPFEYYVGGGGDDIDSVRNHQSAVKDGKKERAPKKSESEYISDRFLHAYLIYMKVLYLIIMINIWSWGLVFIIGLKEVKLTFTSFS